MPQNHPWASYQPLKLLFQLTYTAALIARLPYYTFISLIPSLRPNPQWTFKQSLMTHMVYSLLSTASRLGITTPLTLNPGKEGRRFQRIPPGPATIYKGPVFSHRTKPAEVGGTWFPDSPGQDIASKTVVLYFHGGAFVQYDGRTENCEPLSKYFINKGTADAMFSVQYRLSGYGGLNPFPAALQDALAAYVFLVRELKVPASQIIVAGDSAGGNLTIALLRYLAEFGEQIDVPLPKAAVVHSPWVDPSYTDIKDNKRYSTDLLPTNFLGNYIHNIVTITLLTPQTGASMHTQTAKTHTAPTSSPSAHHSRRLCPSSPLLQLRKFCMTILFAGRRRCRT